MFERKSNEQVGMFNKSINLRSLVSTLTVILLIGFSSSLVNGCGSSNRSGAYSPDMSDPRYLAQNTSKQEFLWQIASQMNESLPVTIDKETLLKNVTASPDGLVYNYILVNHSSQDVNPDILVNSLYPTVKNQVCSEPSTQIFWENDVSLYYSYSGNDNQFITRFVVSPSDCGY